MNEKQLQEITWGTLGYIIWRNCFFVKLETQKLIIKIPFKKFIIPLLYIDKVTSHHKAKALLGFSYAMRGTYLKICHHFPKAPQTIYFLTYSGNAWRNAFEKEGIHVDLRENNSVSAWTDNKIALFIGILGGIVAIAALVSAIIGFLH